MAPDKFVGREDELNGFRRLLTDPNGDKRILFILGGGGIGKTQLVKKMLVEAHKQGILAAEEPLDLFSTDLRHIDGIQLKVIDVIENLTGLKDEQSPFAEFFEENRNTSEQFHKCLQEFCENQPLVLGFDTFENLDTVASNWIFESSNEGLQVPGLICIVAGRPEKDNLDRYRSHSLAREMPISGFTLDEAEEFYQRIANEIGKADPLADFLTAAGIKQNNESIDWVWEITDGHPLRLEMAFRWAGTLLRENSLTNLTAEKFEQSLMERVREFGETGLLDVAPVRASKPVFDTLVCMAYVTRQFDERFLRYLVGEKLIADEPGLGIPDALEYLDKYFFVKRRSNNEGGYILQLHDEMARMVREYVWPFIDPSGEMKQALLQAVIRFYDQLIETTSDEDTQNVLRVEQLYYVLKCDPLGDGKYLWFDLADMDDDYVNSLLPGEIKDYKKNFDPPTRYEIHSRIAQIEFEANHLTQATREWRQVQELGEQEGNNDWIAAALFSLANCEREVGKALEGYQAAVKFCEKKATKYLPRVYYNVGFTYRRMQDMDKAIEWYQKAQDAFQKDPWDEGLGGQIANDLGYAYSHLGEWTECRENVKEGRDIRQRLYSRSQQDVARTEEELERTTEPTALRRLRDLLHRQKAKASKAAFQLGLSFSTLGEIYRYDNDFDGSLRNYMRAYALFEKTNNYRWLAKTLFSRAETRRRIAQAQYKGVDEEQYREFMTKAQDEIQESLYLCEKYRVKEERDTANRRMGRLVHDLAMDELEKGDPLKAQELLEKARFYFQEGLRYALATKDTLEELNNLAELSFIVDDFMVVVGPDQIPEEYLASLDEFKHALDIHRNDKFPIYHFQVFDDLYKLEKAATDYRYKEYEKALKGYLEGFVSLASDPGYGRTRFKQHFPHLTEQIEKLPDEIAKVWCEEFIKAWEKTPVPGKQGRTLAQEIRRPDLVVWCRKQLNKIEAQKG